MAKKPDLLTRAVSLLLALAMVAGIWNVCNIGESWVWMPDGTNSVSDYFQAHYENGTVDYTTQVQQSDSWYTPTTPADVHDSIHYNQIGYNEVGREAARNALILLGGIEAPEVETTVEFLTWDGYTQADEITASTTGNSGTLVVPVVYPVWKSKEVAYNLSEGLDYTYYDLTVDSYRAGGTLTAVGAEGSTVTVTPRELTSYRWDLEDGTLVSTGENENTITRLQGSTADGVFVDTRYALNVPFMLLHDENWVREWKMTGPWMDDASATSKKLFSEDGQQATPGAMAVMVSGKNERLSIGYYGSSTHVSYGISLSEYGISVADTYVYRLVNHLGGDGTNVIYLFVDGQQIGPMTRYFTGSGGDMGAESDYLSGKDLSFGFLGTPSYLLDNGIIEYITVVESGASTDVHFHDWSDWETVTEPGPDGPGEDKRTCAGCGETETRTVESIWQTTNILSHWSELPENVCSGLNLWSVLEHDPKYYVNSKGDWGCHSSREVPSVTIPVNPGDMIFATSFGAAAVNGHGSSNGIRVTWFDINGVLKTTNLVIYTFNDPVAEDVHTQYPTGMKVWLLKFENGAYHAVYVPEFDDLLQYSGSSIRIVGKKGIRMITSITRENRNALTGDGLAGYTLVEYGTALAWAGEIDPEKGLTLGQSYTKSNYTYKRGVADLVFSQTATHIQYTNVLVGFNDEQCIPDIAMRPYIILEDSESNQITIYGGVVHRNIGYIAYQNRNVFTPKSAAYEYVWGIIKYVYGDSYDAEYKG